MQKKLTIAAVMLGLCIGPAFAQTGVPGNESKPSGQETNRADCLKNFRAADANGDGTLSVTEAEDAKDVIPTQLALPGPITEAEFMTACAATVPKGG
jgi:uncharacterized protein YdeI (BOF family)